MFIYLIFVSDEVNPVICLTNSRNVTKYIRNDPHTNYRVNKMMIGKDKYYFNERYSGKDWLENH